MDIEHKKKRKEARQALPGRRVHLQRRDRPPPRTQASHRRPLPQGRRLGRAAAEGRAPRGREDGRAAGQRARQPQQAPLQLLRGHPQRDHRHPEGRPRASSRPATCPNSSASSRRPRRANASREGSSTTGETEEAIRAEAEANHRSLVDTFTEAVKECIDDETLRERIAQAVMAKFPGSGGGPGEDEAA